MKVVAIVQARLGSTRLPGKVMREVRGHRVIDLLLNRLKLAVEVDDVVVATTERSIDDPLVNHLNGIGYRVIRGSENDVLSRFMKAADASAADVIIRVTGDCPLIMPELVDAAVRTFKTTPGLDYLTNTNPPTYPDGFDLEIFPVGNLKFAHNEATESYDREHVTPFLRREARFNRSNIRHERDLSRIRLTVDEALDLEVIERVLDAMAPRLDFGMEALERLIDQDPAMFQLNSEFKRNEGARMGKGQKLWNRAKAIIPGGNMLLSKRAEMMLPEQWPAYFERSKGCQVWDLDGNEFIDMGLMGVGTNTLGYAQPEVDEAVLGVVAKGNLTSLNCPEEVALAERLIEINSFGEMVRFARTGGEANAIAIRIARAASGRDNVAVCGYHGWHDWYLSANLASEANLDGHLLPGLEPKGVPRNLAGTVHTFMYNDIEALTHLVETKHIGVIKMEVYRNVPPADDFLCKVRALANSHNCVLVFDECTSGFRETFGGLHQKFGVEPDLAIYGKTIGNGYALTAVVGRRSVMDAAQSTFISSTFWTERIGPTAALKTLEVMEREKSWEQITHLGQYYRQKLSELAAHHGITIAISGLPAITTWSIPGERALAYKTLITQEMLKTGYLAPPAFYASLAHNEAVIDGWAQALDPVLAKISLCELGNGKIEDLLDGPLAHAGFNRLN